MGRRNKLEKFAELLTFPNVYQNYDPRAPCLKYVNGDEVERKGTWSESHFHNQSDLILELACGGGEYSLSLAEQYPNQNFVGVDIKGNRIWKGARKAIASKIPNVAFLRTRIEQIDLFFAPEEISEIWITFPDPFLRKSKANRRLTSVAFLEMYRRILQKGGTIHLKTDSPELYEFSLETLAQQTSYQINICSEDIYAQPLPIPELEIKTFYEKMHLEDGRKIKYIQFQLQDWSEFKCIWALNNPRSLFFLTFHGFRKD